MIAIIVFAVMTLGSFILMVRGGERGLVNGFIGALGVTVGIIGLILSFMITYGKWG